MSEMPAPLVSICCIAYNHEEYLRQSIESFLIQETSFPYEIVIHDDASTDNTANIIREYEAKYPEIIRPIYQTENQYSKEIMLPFLTTLRAAKGKYVAICEGDDYWTDPLKLQKQITEMMRNPDCAISFHPAVIKWDDEVHDDEVICYHSKEPRIFSIEEVIRGGGSSFIPTASIVFSSAIIPRILAFFAYSEHYPYGDYFIQILGSEMGGALYLSDVMSAYRKNVTGSYSETLEKRDPDFLSSQVVSTVESYREIDEFTGLKYSDLFAFMQRSFILHVLLYPTYDDKRVHDRILAYYWDNSTISNNRVWNIVFRYPLIVKVLRKIKKIKDRGR